MKARLKFNKYGAMKFIGHLDIMRYFQKAFRRAGIDVAYSQGFNPHQLISFAAPLGVGLTSDGEYMDMQLNSVIPKQELIDRVNAAMAEGISVVDFTLLEEGCKKSMSVVAAADYMISLKDGYEVEDDFATKFQAFMAQEEILVVKKAKKKEKKDQELDIRPSVYGFATSKEEFEAITNISYDISNADCYDNDNVVFLQLSTGSVNNLKPELVMEAFAQYLGKEFQPFAYQVHRLEVYANDVSKEEEEKGVRRLVSLGKFEVAETE